MSLIVLLMCWFVFVGSCAVKRKRTDEKEKQNLYKCPSCSASFLSSVTLRRHELDKHSKMMEPVFMVDESRGIFVTTKDKSGPRTIIHICKSFSKQVIDCEGVACREYMAMATGRECIHLERLKNFQAHQQPPVLRDQSIREISEKGLISSSTSSNCLKLQSKAREAGACSVYPIIFGETSGYSTNKMYFSVYTGEVHGWCIFGRVRVTFDVSTGQWMCQCKGCKKRMCLHIYMSMCWTFQEKPEVLHNENENASSPDSDDDLNSPEIQTIDMNTTTHINPLQIKSIVDYLWKTKKQPQSMPDDAYQTAPSIPERFSPEEKICPYCPGPKPPLLEESLVTKEGIVYGILTINKGLFFYIYINGLFQTSYTLHTHFCLCPFRSPCL